MPETVCTTNTLETLKLSFTAPTPQQIASACLFPAQQIGDRAPLNLQPLSVTLTLNFASVEQSGKKYMGEQLIRHRVDTLTNEQEPTHAD
jgi:hypothetical protein